MGCAILGFGVGLLTPFSLWFALSMFLVLFLSLRAAVLMYDLGYIRGVADDYDENIEVLNTIKTRKV